MTGAAGETPDVPVPDAALLPALDAALRAADYRPAAVEELLGPVPTAALDREQTLPARRAARAAGTEPLAVLVRLFLCGDVVTRRELDAALPGVGADGATRLGLAAAAGGADDDAVRAAVDLSPVAYDAPDGTTAAWFVASDLGEATTGAALRPDHVLGVGGASATLARATVRAPRRRTLDLGTGCGIQALYAATHSEEVVATDVSRRALAFARFNAALAGVRLDLREGSMLEPVAGDRFDLVVSNPPFVITPRPAGGGDGTSAPGLPRYEYRDGGRSGDDLVRDLVADVGGVLTPGGVAQMLGNWEHRRGEPWTDRVGAWLDRAGLDAWVVQREVLDPAEYAETWLRDGGATPDRDRDAWSAAYAAWLDDFAARDVEAVGFGLLVLRRPEAGAPTLRRLEEWTAPVRRPLGEHLAAALTAHDWLAAHDDAALLGARLVVAPDVTEERHLRPGADDPTVVLLRQGGGFGRTVRAGTALAGLVGACDGELEVGRLVAALAGLLDVGTGELAAELLPQVRDLVRDGLLVPAG